MESVELIAALSLVAGGLVAGFINVMAGGGSLITLPLLIFLGVPATSANGTIRLAILVQGMTATFRYHRAKMIDWSVIPAIIIPTCMGTLVGALCATQLDDTEFRSIIGWITLVAGAVVAVDLRRFLRDRESAQSAPKRLAFLGAMLVIGLYCGLVQAGAGYLILAALVLGGGFSLVQANILKSVIVTCFTPIAVLVFGLSDQIHISYALLLTLGHAVGAYLGASLNLSRGAQLIRPILAIVVVAAAVKLLLG